MFRPRSGSPIPCCLGRNAWRWPWSRWHWRCGDGEFTLQRGIVAPPTIQITTKPNSYPTACIICRRRTPGRLLIPLIPPSSHQNSHLVVACLLASSLPLSLAQHQPVPTNCRIHGTAHQIHPFPLRTTTTNQSTPTPYWEHRSIRLGAPDTSVGDSEIGNEMRWDEVRILPKAWDQIAFSLLVI